MWPDSLRRRHLESEEEVPGSEGERKFLAVCSLEGQEEADLSERDLKKEEKSEKLQLSALLFSGLYPCPAALLVLVLTFALNIISLGVLAVIAMSFGMCIPITASGYLAWFGRKSLFNKLKNKKIAGYISTTLELLGYVFLFCFSLYTAMPFILSLISKLRG